MAGCRSRQSYADTTSRRLSARDTRARCASVAAWPRKSKVRHTHPRPAMLWARTRSNCWLPPQPWMNSTPGIRVAGARNVPDRSCPSTLIVTEWLLVAMAHHSRGLSDTAYEGVIVVVDQQGVGGLAVAFPIAFRGPGAHPCQAGIGGESL